jgi:hypothetical protein
MAIRKQPEAIWIELEKILVSTFESRDCFVVAQLRSAPPRNDEAC